MIKLKEGRSNYYKTDDTYEFRLDQGGRRWYFEVKSVDGTSLEGEVASGQVQGRECDVLTMRSGDEQFRWHFGNDNFITEKKLRNILKALEKDPGFRDQFRRPAEKLKMVNTAHLSSLIQKAFGDHSVTSAGTEKPTGHSWELATKVVINQKLPDDFMAFARKYEHLSLVKSRGKTALMVHFPLGLASEANAMFLKILTDYTQGCLGTPKDYKLDAKAVSTRLARPSIPEDLLKLIMPNVEEKAESLKGPTHPATVKKILDGMEAGRDRFSGMRLGTLKECVGDAVIYTFEEACKAAKKHHQKSHFTHTFKPDNYLARCIRWHLRGLSVEHAIDKVEQENRAAENSIALRKGDSVYQAL
ncbi:hypothetical protein [Pseudomonas serbica]|uniref:hypothetical protein n=1 Tax=Pseudomonas serbica TaxID=2965074 RepID=UPI00237BEBBA|nr:hypothetical protein [Pseudomonas serbica]